MLTNISKNCKYEISHRPKFFWWELRFFDGLADGHAEANRLFFRNCFANVQKNAANILSYDRSKTSSKAALHLVRFRVSSFK